HSTRVRTVTVLFYDRRASFQPRLVTNKGEDDQEQSQQEQSQQEQSQQEQSQQEAPPQVPQDLPLPVNDDDRQLIRAAGLPETPPPQYPVMFWTSVIEHHGPGLLTTADLVKYAGQHAEAAERAAQRAAQRAAERAAQQGVQRGAQHDPRHYAEAI